MFLIHLVFKLIQQLYCLKKKQLSLVKIKYGTLAQWWSTRLLTDRFQVRVLDVPPKDYCLLVSSVLKVKLN